MADFNNADKKLADLMFMGLDHGIDSVKDSGEALIPFILLETNG